MSIKTLSKQILEIIEEEEIISSKKLLKRKISKGENNAEDEEDSRSFKIQKRKYNEIKSPISKSHPITPLVFFFFIKKY